MPCQHLTQIHELKLPVSDAEALKVLCPICGKVEVCAYTPVTYTDDDLDEKGEAGREPRSSQTSEQSTVN